MADTAGPVAPGHLGSWEYCSQSQLQTGRAASWLADRRWPSGAICCVRHSLMSSPLEPERYAQRYRLAHHNPSFEGRVRVKHLNRQWRNLLLIVKAALASSSTLISRLSQISVFANWTAVSNIGCSQCGEDAETITAVKMPSPRLRSAHHIPMSYGRIYLLSAERLALGADNLLKSGSDTPTSLSIWAQRRGAGSRQVRTPGRLHRSTRSAHPDQPTCEPVEVPPVLFHRW